MPLPHSTAPKSYLGHRFGRLTIVREWRGRSGTGRSFTAAAARCDCGDVAEYQRGNIVAGLTTQCRRCRSAARSGPKTIGGRMPRLRAQWRSLNNSGQLDPAWRDMAVMAAAVGELPAGYRLAPRQMNRPVGPDNWELVPFGSRVRCQVMFRTADGRDWSRADVAALLGFSRQYIHQELRDGRGWRLLDRFNAALRERRE